MGCGMTYLLLTAVFIVAMRIAAGVILTNRKEN